MGSDPEILLRAWYRLPGDVWIDVLRSASKPLVVRLPDARFIFEAFYDPGPLTKSPDRSTVVFKGYLRDVPPARILRILRGDRPSTVDSRAGSKDGLGTLADDYANYIRRKAMQISRLATKIYDLLLWRNGILDGPVGLTASPTSLFWTPLALGKKTFIADKLDWAQVPSGMCLLDVPQSQPLDLRSQVGPQLVALIDKEPQAPLGHVLLREAWQLRGSNLRSALVMGVAASETGLKEFVRKASPDTSWLVENLQSPPLDKMLREYLPRLISKAPAQETVPEIPKEWRRSLHDAVEARNRVVHGRSVDLDYDTIESFLEIVRDFLYFLDYHAGRVWALDSRRGANNGPMGG